MATETSLTKLPAREVEEAVRNGHGLEAEVATNAREEPFGNDDITVLAVADTCSGRWVIAGDARVLGVFDGEIECAGDLLIGRGAEVAATIRGNDVTIAGSVRGNVLALARLRITPTGRLEGDARVGALIVDEGGVHHGVIRVHPEGVPDDPEPAPAAPEASVAAAAATRVDRVKRFWGEFF
jgi:cytoskeletal protein CcmA (bactofilin family)